MNTDISDFMDDFIYQEDVADMCSCSICGWKGKCDDCETEWEQDGWEGNRYQIHLCPICEDGGSIDDYWTSK